MSFTASFTAYQRVGASRRANERTGPEHRRPADPSGDGADVVGEGSPDGGPAAA